MKIGNLLLRLLLGKRRAEQVRLARIMRSPDRDILLGSYLPDFAAAGGRILWIGCREYTAGYPALLESQGAEVWTTDIDEAAQGFGREGRHRTGDIRFADQLFGDMTFDAILCNGVLGFGVNAPEDQSRALTAMAAILRPGGRMLLGWNLGRIGDPVAAGLTAPHYAAAPSGGSPSRVVVPGVTHVFDHFVRLGA